MTYTIQSAKYANAENTAAVLLTAESGAVLVSEVDRPELWAAMLAWGTPDDYATPPAPAPSWTPLEFIERFTDAEQIAIVTAAQSNPALRLFYDKLMASLDVKADEPRLIAGMQAVVDAGLITAERRDEILAGP